MKQELRAYSFSNRYLSSFQQGNQTAHSRDECVIKYIVNPYGKEVNQKAKEMYVDWLVNYKVGIVLNGGDHESLTELYEFLSSVEHDFPFEQFHESGGALRGSLTNITIVLPERIFKYSKLVNNVIRMMNDRKTTFVTIREGELDLEEGSLIFKKYADEDSGNKFEFTEKYTPFEIELMARISSMRLAI